MKKRSILSVVILLSFSIPLIYAVPEPDPGHAFNFAETVIVGKILSVEIISEPQITKSENSYSERSGIAIYEVQIEKYLKNPDSEDVITVTGYFLREPHPMAYETYPYEHDQRVLLYLSKNKDVHTNTDLIIGAANSKIIDGEICGVGIELRNGVCTVVNPKSDAYDGCLIATASYGSELSPQVQMLREIRDNTLLNTESGKIFMSGFNSIYYSFSPQVAQLENKNPIFKEAVKLFITPMITILSIMTLSNEGSELQILLFGASTMGLIVGMYVVAPVVTLNYIWRKRK